MDTINDIQDAIIEEFADFDDWMDRYAYIIDGCQSRVWLVATYADGKIHFAADSDAIIVKGIISLLVRVLSDRTPQEILDSELYFIEKIGLKEHLSPTRSNGLAAMIKQIRLYALAFKAKSQG